MEHSSYCVICLATDMKMMLLNATMLAFYKGLILNYDELSTKHIYACCECAYLLYKYRKFKEKCQKAYNILCIISPEPFEASKEILKSINRKENKLISELKICTIANYEVYDYCNSEEQFVDGLIKTESDISSIQENFYDIQVESHVIDPIPIDDNLSYQPIKYDEEIEIPIDDNLSYQLVKYEEEIENPIVDNLSNQSRNNEEIKSDITIESAHDTEDDNSTLSNMLSSYNNLNNSVSVVNVVNTKEDNTQVPNDNNVESVLKLKFFDSNSDNDMRFSNKSSLKTDSKMISRTKERKVDTIKKINLKTKTVTKIIRTCDVDNNKSNKQPQSKEKKREWKKRSLKVKDKTNEDVMFSIKSSSFKENMTIVKLTKEEAINEMLLRKESVNYKRNTHKCDLCYRGFITEITYQTHMKKHSSEFGTVQCDICQLRFSKNSALNKHKGVFHSRKFVCKNCPYECFVLSQASGHIRSHKGKTYTCKECGEIFRFSTTLSSHIRCKHNKEFVCDFCGCTYASPGGLDSHKRLRHRKEKNEHLGPRCDECDVHFASELAWKRHRVLCSRHQVQNGCGLCGETFVDASALRKHVPSHGPPQATYYMRLCKKPPAAADCTPLPCAYCDAELGDKKEYKRHVASAHPERDRACPPPGSPATPRPLVCEVCGKVFKHHSHFAVHHRSHTGEKPFECPDCGKRFKSAVAVRMHRPLHTNQLQHKCHLCDKAFPDVGKLNRHIKSHSGVRPFKCPYCDKAFTYQYLTNTHVTYVHSKEPYPKRDRSKRTGKTKK